MRERYRRENPDAVAQTSSLFGKLLPGLVGALLFAAISASWSAVVTKPADAALRVSSGNAAEIAQLRVESSIQKTRLDGFNEALGEIKTNQRETNERLRDIERLLRKREAVQ